jgi:fatty acid amide hydrolase 2
MRAREMLTASATELARAIRERRVTSAEVVEAHIARTRRVNPHVNAVVRDRFDAARAEAREADARVADTHPDDLPPLCGVPCSIKEAFALTGMPNSSGLWTRRDRISTSDATAVARLRAAGAIPLGVTNVSELCMWMESSNAVYGRTNNPFHLGSTAGGSSGGEGAIVGAGAVPFGLGSDVGGSIRMPAFFNGVFGHKPTGGLVPNTGQYPGAHGVAQRYVTTGPITRRATDLMPLLRVLSGPDGIEERCIDAELGDPRAIDLSKLVVHDVPDNGRVRVAASLRGAQERALRHLGRRGARVVKTEIPELRASLEIWSAMLEDAEGPTFRDLMADGGPFAPWRELARTPLSTSRYTLPGVLLALVERVPKLFPERSRELRERGVALRAKLDALLGDDAVMLFPSHAIPAPRHREPLLFPFRWVYTAIINVMELPATQVPLGLGPHGKPLGVQVIGGRGRDHATIAVALELERAFGGWVPPRPLPLGWA